MSQNSILTNNNIYVDKTNKFIGINVSTPNNTLDVYGDINVYSNYLINGSNVLSENTLSNQILYSSLQTLGNLDTLNVNGNSIFDNNLYCNSINGNTNIQTLFGIGIQGFQGTQGFVGSQGYIGINGNQGLYGNQGFIGIFQGFQGFQGFQNIIGFQGYRGFQGLQGYQGNQGFQGNQGVQGFQGNQGIIGIQGNQGISNYVLLKNIASTSLTSTTSVTITSSNTWYDISGLSLSFTPLFSSSRVLLFVSIDAGSSTSFIRAFTLVRNSTYIGQPTGSGQITANFGTYPPSLYVATTTHQPFSWSYIDSPSTTSTITYKIQCTSNVSSSIIYINCSSDDSTNNIIHRCRAVSTLTAIEVGAY